MRISPLTSAHLPQAAALFVQSFQKQRRAVSVLPARMAKPQLVADLLADRAQARAGLAALEGERLLGYLAWYYAKDFRGTGRKGAYCPEWGHACAQADSAPIYQALYRAAATQWFAQGCQVHAITLLAHDRAAERDWFWNGFGLAVVDAARPLRPLDAPPNTDLHIRQAGPADARAFVDLDAEHRQHYTQAPVFMPRHPGFTAEDFHAHLSRPKNSIWLALDGETPAGFLRFEGYDFEGAAIVASGQTISINGAYMRPAYRRRGAGAAMLDAALRHYAGLGITCCSVDFESFNPEAANFWMKHFQPVCFSLLRVPETLP
ncbi:MAG: GNAT family N-acetyltransferase [Chloroflexota bacterium]